MELETSKNNIVLLDQVVKGYQPNEYNDILKALPRSYAVVGFEKNRTMKSVQNMNLYKPETHIHETMSGIYVRSKSEMIIANELTAYGIAFSYEPKMSFLTASGRKIYPDFVIQCPDGYIFVWEHWGLLSDIDYCTNQVGKLNAYHENGFTIGQNLLITADDNKGGFNAQVVKQHIKNLILPHMGLH